MGVASGPRILINDIKPSYPFVEQAQSFNIMRNIGVANISI